VPTRKNRPYPSGYDDHAHKVMRRRLAPVATGTVECAHCGELIEPGSPWQLDHRDDGRGWLGPSVWDQIWRLTPALSLLSGHDLSRALQRERMPAPMTPDDEFRAALEQSARSATDANVELGRLAAAKAREASPTATAPSATPDMQESNLAERPQPAVSP
jgi:hypothetical protein